jgi:hypothetical protein
MYDAVIIFDLLKPPNQKHTTEIRRQRATEEAEKAEPLPEPEETDKTFLKLNEELGFFEADIKVFKESVKEQRAAATRQGVMRMLTLL